MKKNKIIISAVSAIFAGVFAVSCTGNFEEMNTNPNEVDPADLPLSAQCSEPLRYCYPPQQNMFQFWGSLTFDWYSGYFCPPHSNFTNVDMGENRGHSGGMYENYYLHIFNNTRKLITMCEEAGNNGLAATFRVVQAYGTLQCTDTYGPIAYSSILSGEYESWYPFDSQQQIFGAMLDDLAKAVADLQGMSADEKTTLATYDEWCGGDSELWIKVANTLRLRMCLRLSKRVDEMAAGGYDIKKIAAEAAANTLANGGKDIYINKQLENEMWLMFAWADGGFNANLVSLMTGLKDPRQPYYMMKNTGYILTPGTELEYDEDNNVKDTPNILMKPNTDYVGIRFAAGLPAKGADDNVWGNYSGWPTRYDAPLPMFKQAESYFLLAEAALRGWISGNVKVHYEDGIRASINNEYNSHKDWRVDGAEAITAPTEADINAYINGETGQADHVDPAKSEYNAKAVNPLGVKWDDVASNEDKLWRIMTQKYIAVFPLAVEAWPEQRRTGYPKLFEPLVNKSQGNVTSSEGVRRQLYSSNAYTTNDQGVTGGIELLNKENSSTSGHSGDIGGTRVWWDNAAKGNFD